MKILHYCQHVLGIGHFYRSLEIIKALDRHQVLLVTGGPKVKAEWPSHVRHYSLPGLMMDAEFDRLQAVDERETVERIKETRKKLLYDIFKKEAPDVFLVELFPFGRGSFRFELEPVLEGIRNGDLPRALVVCSLRDILVEKKDPVSYEQRVISLLNDYFDGLLVHADPSLIRLDRTFSRTADIKRPVVYTGFVTARPRTGARAELRGKLNLGREESLILASAGGGKVGRRLLEAVMKAIWFAGTHPLHLQVFTGPYMEAGDFAALKALAGPRVRLSCFTAEFPDYLAAADLSLSLAGYNTCLNLVAAGVPALVWPFDQNREQRLRAESLAGVGALEVLQNRDLEPHRLAGLMDRLLGRKKRSRPRINLNGARVSAKWIEKWARAKK